MRVVIIDSNETRKKSLQAQLANMGIISCLAVMVDGSVERNLMNADVIVWLDEVWPGFDKQFDHYPKVIITNVVNLKEQCSPVHHIFLVSNKDEERHILEKISTMYRDDNKNVFFPVVEDPRSKKILDFARKAANSKASVLISGETGVGKELLARYIHYHSPFFNGPFVSVNCAAMPDNMVEAILFGYEKGAFTGAINSYAGKFEQAQNGTLLLDEVSEIPIGLQAKLLRVLQEREVERLCGKNIININVRVIAATNRDLVQLVRSGMFRKDLYYRLNVLTIHCAALRERSLDIIPMAEYFIQKHSDALDRKPPRLTHEARQKLLKYDWPGNIREMDNVIQRLLIMTNSDVIDAIDIHLNDAFCFDESPVASDTGDVHVNSGLKANEANMIVKVLKEVDGCREVAAKKLKISPRTLRYKISRLKMIGWEVP